MRGVAALIVLLLVLTSLPAQASPEWELTRNGIRDLQVSPGDPITVQATLSGNTTGVTTRIIFDNDWNWTLDGTKVTGTVPATGGPNRLVLIAEDGTNGTAVEWRFTTPIIAWINFLQPGPQPIGQPVEGRITLRWLNHAPVPDHDFDMTHTYTHAFRSPAGVEDRLDSFTTNAYGHAWFHYDTEDATPLLPGNHLLRIYTANGFAGGQYRYYTVS